MADSAFKSRLLPILPEPGHELMPLDHICPECGCQGCVVMNRCIVLGEPHLNWHCGCCGHVSIEKDRRSIEDRLPKPR